MAEKNNYNVPASLRTIVGNPGDSLASPLQRQPDWSAAQIRAILAASADPAPGVTGFNIAWGYGRVDPAAALGLLS